MTPRSALRLPFLDGLRGLAALYVVFYHAYCTSDCTASGWRHTLPVLLQKLLRWLLHGNLAVDVFIVLSGFCLMLPIVTHPEQRLEGGFGRYITRRARRILPAYFAAVAFTLALIALIPALGTKAGVYWDSALPAFQTDVLLSHLFVVHNLDPAWSSKISYPLWSVATEWQIYFFLPLLILPLWRRFGMPVAVIAASVLSLLPHFLFLGIRDPNGPLFLGLFEFGATPGRFDPAYPHFLGLFAIGAAGAVIGLTRDPQRSRWGAVALALWIPLLLCMQFRHAVFALHRIPMDFVVGLATMALLVYGAHCTRRQENSASPLLRLLEAPAIVWLGAISYSLYLIHAPVLASLHVVTRGLQLPSLPTLLVLIGIGVPLSLLAAFGFHLACEKPFLTRRVRIVPEAAPSLP